MKIPQRHAAYVIFVRERSRILKGLKPGLFKKIFLGVKPRTLRVKEFRGGDWEKGICSGEFLGEKVYDHKGNETEKENRSAILSFCFDEPGDKVLFNLKDNPNIETGYIIEPVKKEGSDEYTELRTSYLWES